MGKPSKVVIIFAVILNTFVLAASLWLIIKAVQLRDQESALNLILSTVFNMWACDAFAVFGAIALILGGVGYVALCFWRNSFLYFQIGFLVLYTCVAGYFLYPPIKDYINFKRASDGDVNAMGESIKQIFGNLLNNAKSR